MWDEFFLELARTPAIQSDACYAIITSESRAFTGNMTIDEARSSTLTLALTLTLTLTLTPPRLDVFNARI